MVEASSFLSQTLQSITATKTREQQKRRKNFEDRKKKIIETASHAVDERARLEVLLSGFRDLSSSNKGIRYVDDGRKSVLQNTARYLEQSRYDPSVSLDILRSFEENLQRKLNQESERFSFADLYYRLLAEWTDVKSKPMVESERNQKELDGSFEHVQKFDLQDLKDKFSNVVFTPLETDEAAIDAYLNSLFDDDHAEKILKETRNGISQFAAELKQRTVPFDSHIIKASIRSLLTNSLLNDDAKATLSDFSTNDVVLNEIADVLNLRFSDLDNWTWEADEGLYYEPRQQLNGKYRIMMDQDILQAIFLHYIAVSWCVELKSQFSNILCNERFWKGPKIMTADEEARYNFFMGTTRSNVFGVEEEKKSTFRNTFLLSTLPKTFSEDSDPYDEQKGPKDKTNSGRNIRQMLLRQIATDVIIRQALHGDVAVVQSDLQWYATGLPHSTLFAVLRFWGVPEEWITFFKKYAEAPLRMDETPGENVRTRKRGIPITDAFEKLFGECVLFCMDVAVNRLAEATLIRFHDDLWLSGNPSTCASAWETIETFVRVLGLDINTSKTGSVYISDAEKDASIASRLPEGQVCIGMLQLTDSGDWTIDQTQVSAHVRQLQKQLGQCQSIISWIQTWNACMSNFFQSMFGQPADCFGQEHVSAILETYANMQRELFEFHNGSVTQYLREQISHRFGVQNIPDSFFFLPEELGGLGLKNPFVPFFVLKDQLMKNPHMRVTKFLQEEQDTYRSAKESFISLPDSQKQLRFNFAYEKNPKYSAILDEPFLSFEEYTSYREVYSHKLKLAYLDLMRVPEVQDIELVDEIRPWFSELVHSHDMGWHDLSSENKWIMHLYAEELKQKFGALSIVDKNLLPSGIMKMLKRKKVVWQLIIWG
jgi:hypothetical protein